MSLLASIYSSPKQCDPIHSWMVARHDDFVRRFNASDGVGIAMTFYASDAVIYAAGQPPIVGRTAILAFLRAFHEP